MTSTVERARGRWREILTALGVEDRFLSGRQGPCPICQGKTRFRFTDMDSDGWAYCNKCGGLPGIVLLRRLNGWDHKTACCEIDRIIGTDWQPVPPNKPARSDDAAKRAAIERLFSGVSDNQIVTDWLRSRDLAVSSPVLFGRRACARFDDGKLVGYFPTVIAPVTSPSGDLISAQRLYLDNVKKTMPPVGTINGAAVRLQDADDVIGVSEGVATGLAAFELFGVPTWAALSAHGVMTFEPPAGLHRLHIFADNDANFVGQQAAFELARRVSGKLEVKVDVPPEPGLDWNDVLRTEKRR